MIKVKVDDFHQFLIEKIDDYYKVNENKEVFDIQKTSSSSFSIIYQHKSFEVSILNFDTRQKLLEVKVNGHTHKVALQDEHDLILDKMGMLKKKNREISVLKAPMPGLIIEIKVNEGQEVKKDEPLIILKAMKMENILRSPIDGTVRKILVQQNQKIEKEAVIIQF
jgi:biotin carboxyl carrier protein